MTKRPKTRANAPGSAARTPAPKGHNSEMTADQRQDLFLKQKGLYADSLAAKKKYDKLFKDDCQKIIAHGFTIAQVKEAIEMDTPEGEAKVRARIADTLQAASWVGSHHMGNLLAMFMQPDRTPSVDRCYDEGKRTSMENKPGNCGYDPNTEQYRAFMNGFNDHQRELAGGFKAPGAHAHADTPQDGGEPAQDGAPPTDPAQPTGHQV